MTVIANPTLVTMNEANYDSELVDGAHVNFIVPQSFNIFILDDIFSTIDDAVYLMLLDAAGKLTEGEFANLVIVLEAILDTNPGFIVEGIINRVIDFIQGLSWEDWQLTISELREEFEIDGHAPIDIITGMLLSSEGYNATGGVIGLWNNDGQIEWNSGTYYKFWLTNDGNSLIGIMFYSNYAPTLGTLISPLIDPDTQIGFSNFEQLSDKSIFYLWTIQFILVCNVSITVFFVMMLINTFAINFEQYYSISGIFIMFSLLFSGLFLPLTWILSTPLMYTIAIFLPSTAPVMLMVSISSDSLGLLGLQKELPMENTFIYPILISVACLMLTYKMLSRDGSKLVSKFIHDPLSERASKINFAFSLVFFTSTFILMFALVNQRDIWVHDQVGGEVTRYYPTNFQVFVSITITYIYSLIVFANFINWKAKSATFNNHRSIFAIMNSFLLFPIGIVTLFMTLNSKTIIANEKYMFFED